VSIILGFPDELPEAIAIAVNELAQREIKGDAVPSLIASWIGEDGRRHRLVWQPQVLHQTSLQRYGLIDRADGPGVA
jgi:hypothetical protein